MCVSVPAFENEQESGGQEKEPFRWRCLCPRADWRTNAERAQANDIPVWLQWAVDGALTLLRHAYELSEGSDVTCSFVEYQRLFGGRKLTADDDLGDALIVFNWALGARQHTYRSKVLYEELARAADQYCHPTKPCNCNAGSLIEVPADMAQRLLELDVPRQSMMTTAKHSEDVAATMFPCGPGKSLKTMSVTPLHLLRFTRFRAGYSEEELPPEQPLRCVYLGQPKGDGHFAHASFDWTSPERGTDRTKVSFEWRKQRGGSTPGCQDRSPAALRHA